MYPSINNYNHNLNPVSLSGQATPHRHLFDSDINPDSTSLFHFPSPFIQYEDVFNELTWQQLHDLFIQQQPFTPQNSVTESVNNMEDPKHDAVNAPKQGWEEICARMPEQIIRKRSSKKDRHSKITTAHGPRDRRMRLSLDIARKFFDLQDILGFDKASKTVEWLLIQSNSAIKEIMKDLPWMRQGRASVGANASLSSTSECEVVSGIDDSTTIDNHQESISLKMKKKSSCKKEKKATLARRKALHPRARESREVARERARKRTIEKRKLGETKLCLEAKGSNLKQLRCWGHDQFEAVEESGTYGSKIINLPPTHEGLKEVEELINSQGQRLHDQETRDSAAGDILVITGNWNPSSSIYSYQPTAEISSMHQFSDFQFCGKAWEACNNTSLGG